MAKLAMLVGINNYKVARYNLRGCVDDVESLASLLKDNYGFNSDSIVKLTNADATRGAIVEGLSSMLASARADDTFVFGFSGHGTQKRASGPEETDQKDECLVPYETNYDSLIEDNELQQIIGQYVGNENFKFTAIFDCCHAATMARELKFDDDGEIREEVINRCLDMPGIEEVALRSRHIGPFNVLSACQDNETAADVRAVGPSGRPRGAFSYALHKFLRANKDAPASAAESMINSYIGQVSGHTQNPMLQTINAAEPLLRY